MKHFALGLIIGLCIVKCITFDWSSSANTVAGSSHSCTEDSWCWNSLVNGNHLGSVPVFQ